MRYVGCVVTHRPNAWWVTTHPTVTTCRVRQWRTAKAAGALSAHPTSFLLRELAQCIDDLAIVRVAHPHLDHLVEHLRRGFPDQRLAPELLRELNAVLRVFQPAFAGETHFLPCL